METKTKKESELLQKGYWKIHHVQATIVLKRLTFADSCCKKGVHEKMFPMYITKKKEERQIIILYDGDIFSSCY